MDYKKIVCFGFIESISQDRIVQYLNRMYKSAEKDYYTVSEFFDGCTNTIDLLEKIIHDNFPTWQKDKANLLKEWQEVIFYKDHEGTIINHSKDELRKRTIKELQAELKNNKDTYKMLFTFKKNNIDNIKDQGFIRAIKKDENKTKIYISIEDLNTMKKSIEEVRSNLEPKKKKQDKSTNIEPLNFELKANEVVYLFDILQEAGFLLKPKFHEGSYYKKLETLFTANKKPINNATSARDNYLKNDLKNKQIIKDKLIKALEKL